MVSRASIASQREVNDEITLPTIADIIVPPQLSSQNRLFLPSPIFHVMDKRLRCCRDCNAI
jgi:hypothetical protein